MLVILYTIKPIIIFSEDKLPQNSSNSSSPFSASVSSPCPQPRLLSLPHQPSLNICSVRIHAPDLAHGGMYPQQCLRHVLPPCLDFSLRLTRCAAMLPAEHLALSPGECHAGARGTESMRPSLAGLKLKHPARFVRPKPPT